MLRTSGDWFADFDQLQDRLDELFGGRAATSSIRAVGRAGAFPALNVGTSGRGARDLRLRARRRSEVGRGVGREGRRSAIAGERALGAATRARRQGAEERNVYANERFSGRFRRVVALPEDADPSARRGELSQRRAEDRRAEARSIEAAPDPGDERAPERAPAQSKGDTTMATASQQRRAESKPAQHLPAPRRRCCRRSTSSRTAPASRSSPTCPASVARISRSASTAAA